MKPMTIILAMALSIAFLPLQAQSPATADSSAELGITAISDTSDVADSAGVAVLDADEDIDEEALVRDIKHWLTDSDGSAGFWGLLGGGLSLMAVLLTLLVLLFLLSPVIVLVLVLYLIFRKNKRDTVRPSVVGSGATAPATGSTTPATAYAAEEERLERLERERDKTLTHFALGVALTVIGLVCSWRFILCAGILLGVVGGMRYWNVRRILKDTKNKQ